MRTEVNYTEEVEDPVDSDGAWYGCCRKSGHGGSLLSKFSGRVSLRCAGWEQGAGPSLTVTGLDVDTVLPGPPARPLRHSVCLGWALGADTFLLLQ